MSSQIRRKPALVRILGLGVAASLAVSGAAFVAAPAFAEESESLANIETVEGAENAEGTDNAEGPENAAGSAGADGLDEAENTEGADSAEGSENGDTDTPDVTLVEVPNVDLKAALNAALGSDRAVDQDITVEEAAAGPKSLRVRASGVDDLTGLEAFTNTTTLTLKTGVEVDLAPLEALDNVTDLTMTLQPVKSLEPVTEMDSLIALRMDSGSAPGLPENFGARTSLKTLNIDRTGISDLSSLEGSTTLADLSAVSNGVESLDFISADMPLTAIMVNESAVTDISPVFQLSNLATLHLSGSPIDWMNEAIDFAALPKMRLLNLGGTGMSELPRGLEDAPLQQLTLEANPLTDISDLAQYDLSNLSILNIADTQVSDISAINRVTSLKNLFAENTPLGANVPTLATLTGLTILNVTNTGITSLKGVERMPKLSNLYAENNQITSVEPLSKLTQNLQATLTNNAIADLSPLKERTNTRIWATDQRISLGRYTNEGVNVTLKDRNGEYFTVNAPGEYDTETETLTLSDATATSVQYANGVLQFESSDDSELASSLTWGVRESLRNYITSNGGTISASDDILRDAYDAFQWAAPTAVLEGDTRKIALDGEIEFDGAGHGFVFTLSDLALEYNAAGAGRIVGHAVLQGSGVTKPVDDQEFLLATFDLADAESVTRGGLTRYTDVTTILSDEWGDLYSFFAGYNSGLGDPLSFTVPSDLDSFGSFVAPVKPTFVNNVIVVPRTEGVEYQIGGKTVTGGVAVTKDTTVTAVVLEGYVLERSAKASWKFNYVKPAPVQMKVSAGTVTQKFGSTKAVSVTVAGKASGSLKGFAGTKTVTAKVSAGKAKVNIPAAAFGTSAKGIGAKTVTWVFTPTDKTKFATSVGTSRVNVVKGAASVSVKTSKTKVTKGGKVTITATVKSGSVKATGKVKISVAGKTKTVSLKSGTAKVTLSKLSKVGKKQTVKVQYLGSSTVNKKNHTSKKLTVVK